MPLDGAGGAVVGFLAYAALAVVALRVVLSYKSVAHAARRLWRWADEWAQAYQYYEVPRLVGGGDAAENPLFRKAAAYVSSLPSLDDADAACVLSSATKSNDFWLQLGPGHTAHDAFLGARLAWTNGGKDGLCSERLVLRVRRHDRTRVLRPYLQHVESVADEMELRRRDLRLYANTGSDAARWASAPFTHPATLDTVAMDPELKTRVRADLESFLKGRAYYHRLGRVWRRSYLLYGPHGTGKSTFAAAMARFLGYDVYDIDLSRSGSGSDDLRAMLLATAPRSLILVEDLDRYLRGGDGETSAARAARVLGFMDGLSSCCGEERVMVFTMSGGKEGVDPAVLRPGRLDVHIHFTMCDFEGFKTLASNYLGLKDHKLYPQVEEGFHAGARLSPAELGEIMLANRGSPSRALRTVINALQHVAAPPARTSSAARPPRLSSRLSGHLDESNTASSESNAAASLSPGTGGGFGKDAPMREIKKLYGLIKIRSRKEGGVVPVDDTASANGRGSDASTEKDR